MDSSLTVSEFLEPLLLMQYADKLHEEGFERVADMMGFEETDLENELKAAGVKPVHLKRIIRKLRSAPVDATVPSAHPASGPVPLAAGSTSQLYWTASRLTPQRQRCLEPPPPRQ
jgi:hypothetical protein